MGRLLVAERDHRIHSGGPRGGQVAGEERGARESGGGRGERQRVLRVDAEELRFHEPAQPVGDGEADGDADRGERPHLDEDHTEDGAALRAEVADRDETRSLGLMHRTSLPPNGGMLFVFDQSAVHCMWMKNTLLPLSVAFLDEAGAIVNIADMQPLDEATHCAARPARYALEMTQGWFAERGIRAGMRLRGLEQLKSR